MELLIAAAAAVLIHILANEACAHAPGLTGRLIGLAARRLPIAIRDRYREEWLAHMRDLPGALTKLGFGVQCVVASQALRAIPEEYWAQSRQRLIKVRDVEMLVDTNVLVQILTVFRQVKSEADVVAHLEREIEKLTAEGGDAPLTARGRKQMKDFASAFTKMTDHLGEIEVQVEEEHEADAAPEKGSGEREGY